MITNDHIKHRGQPAAPSAFAAGRARAVDRLVRAGMSGALAQTWIDTWDESTADLTDFRAADDFWELGFRYAVEEHRRGYRPPGVRSLAG